VRLVQGQGFAAGFLWQSKEPPALMEKPQVHWVPIPSIGFFAIRE